ncbi:hypothetical protein [Clostridium hydrogenum]|uniref:hypothetical protein n=1 Tax=Clostridium hydrogenum TaxID=2855764 RepID=UPI001F2BF78C|nr:hypothetical protein [Clostridium hydrogenum]
MKKNLILCTDEELWNIKMSLWAYRNFLFKEKRNGNKNADIREKSIRNILCDLEKN